MKYAQSATAGISVRSDAHYRTIVTGATGFVGGELIKELLVSSGRSLICPVRADSHRHANQRGTERLTELFGSPTTVTEYADRVEWVRAELTEQHLGLDGATWRRLAATTDEIFHCAASVSFDLPLEEAHQINVDGTKHVFALASDAARAHKSFRRFHHVSTAYVSGRKRGWVDAHHLPRDRGSAFRNTYERTKARAERWLRQQASGQTPITIHRPSIVAGYTHDGATSCWNVLYVPMKMAAKGRLPVFTYGGSALVDAVGVDFVVRAMATFAATDTAPLVAHHLTAGRSVVTVPELIDVATQTAGVLKTRMLSPIQWAGLGMAVRTATKLPTNGVFGRLSKVRSKARLAQRGLDRCKVYEPYLNVETIFDPGDAHTTLAAFGIAMPPGAVYLDRITRYAVATDFGRRPLVEHDPIVEVTTKSDDAMATPAPEFAEVA